jgi:hypothetical protein
MFKRKRVFKEGEVEGKRERERVRERQREKLSGRAH